MAGWATGNGSLSQQAAKLATLAFLTGDARMRARHQAAGPTPTHPTIVDRVIIRLFADTRASPAYSVRCD
ncbi:hypothetical protein GCM10017776_59530 [Streptomyces griseoluteus]|nr:hypothetical protein GCM10017776_59530 [Streptomyces griseoluteus]